MRVGIVGSRGLMAGRRAKLFPAQDYVVAAYDVVQAYPDCVFPDCYSLDELLTKDIEAVLVATPHDALASSALACIRAEKGVLLEKPCARSAKELAPVVAAALDADVPVVPGFTLRHYPGIIAARDAVRSTDLGRMRYLRAVYGHGGRPGYAGEWRCDPDRGGGELLDQGTHLIDLARCFLGPDTHLAHGTDAAPLWTPAVEDSVFLTLQGPGNTIAQLQASWTEWRPIFRLEVLCENGGVRVEGLGGPYGDHRLSIFHRHGTVIEANYGDARESALAHEWADFRRDMTCRFPHGDPLRQAAAGLIAPWRAHLQDALAVLALTDAYRAAAR